MFDMARGSMGAQYCVEFTWSASGVAKDRRDGVTDTDGGMLLGVGDVVKESMKSRFIIKPGFASL